MSTYERGSLIALDSLFEAPHGYDYLQITMLQGWEEKDRGSARHFV